MTALTGLDLRLRLARLALAVDLDRSVSPPDLPAVAELASRSGVQLLVIGQGGQSADALLPVLDQVRAVVQGTGLLVGLAGDVGLAGAYAADVLHLAATSGPGAAGPTDEARIDQLRPLLHPWALVGRSVEDTDTLAAATADPEPDYLFVDRQLTADAVRLAPPSGRTSVPWFAVVSDVDPLDAVDHSLTLGARRLALAPESGDLDMLRARFREFSSRLSSAWGEDPTMQTYKAATMADERRPRA